VAGKLVFGFEVVDLHGVSWRFESKDRVPAARVDARGTARAHDLDEVAAGRSPDPMSIDGLPVFLAFGYGNHVYFGERSSGRVERHETPAVTVHITVSESLLASITQVLGRGNGLSLSVVCRDRWEPVRLHPDLVLPPDFKNERPGELVEGEVIEWSLRGALFGSDWIGESST
jgi:hypothetical protein